MPSIMAGMVTAIFSMFSRWKSVMPSMFHAHHAHSHVRRHVHAAMIHMAHAALSTAHCSGRRNSASSCASAGAERKAARIEAARRVSSSSLEFSLNA
jgi:hypothetical protein